MTLGLMALGLALLLSVLLGLAVVWSFVLDASQEATNGSSESK